jgi:hypothetical protein
MAITKSSKASKKELAKALVKQNAKEQKKPLSHFLGKYKTMIDGLEAQKK